MMEETKPRHSRLGIASFITAIAVGILVPLDMVASAALMWSMQGEDASKFIPLFIAMGFILILAYGGNLAGIGLGIAGIRQKDRNRVFAIIGLCLNSAGALIGTLFVVSGLIIHSPPPPTDSAAPSAPGYVQDGVAFPEP